MTNDEAIKQIQDGVGLLLRGWLALQPTVKAAAKTSKPAPVEAPPAVAPAPAPVAPPVAPPTPPAAPPLPPLTAEEVRRAAIVIGQNQGIPFITAALAKFNVRKLVELKPDQYEGFLKEVGHAR
jgi:hypothetical protein